MILYRCKNSNCFLFVYLSDVPSLSSHRLCGGRPGVRVHGPAGEQRPHQLLLPRAAVRLGAADQEEQEPRHAHR